MFELDEDHTSLYHRSRSVQLKGHAIWSPKCGSNLSMIGEHDVQRLDRKIHGGIHGKHAGKVQKVVDHI